MIGVAGNSKSGGAVGTVGVVGARGLSSHGFGKSALITIGRGLGLDFGSGFGASSS